MGRHTTKLGEASRAETRPPLPYPVRDGRIAPPRQEAMDRRSQRRRSRLAALSAASMLALGGAAGMSMAMADEPESSGGGEIVFSGDCGALNVVSPTSKPSTSQVTVTRGSEVEYTNDLGVSAELYVGNETYDIGSGSTQVFVMNRSAEIAMVPDCRGLFAQYESAQVNVVDAPQSEEQDTSEGRDDSDPSAAELPSRGSGGDSDGTSEQGGDSRAPGEATGADGDGTEGSGTEGSGTDESGTDESDAEAEATAEEQADDKTGETDEEEVNSFGPAAGTDGDGGDSEFIPAGSDEVVAVDPKAVSDGASGLLALVAIVCLVGVSAAVMRTLLRQRATA